MYRRYRRDEEGWLEGLRQAHAFIAGPLHQHVTTWPRYGRLGVQEYLDSNELCKRLPRLLDHLGDFVLAFGASSAAASLLVIEVGPEENSIALCYGAWPGTRAWETQIQPALSPGLPLSRTFWNRMPRLKDLGDAARDQVEATVVDRRRAWLDEEHGVPLFLRPHRGTLEATEC